MTEHETSPLYGPFDKQTTRVFDTIAQARFQTELYLISRRLAGFVLSRYDQEALAITTNNRMNTLRYEHPAPRAV